MYVRVFLYWCVHVSAGTHIGWKRASDSLKLVLHGCEPWGVHVGK